VKKKQSTIVDVAKKAGVSTKTVSRVINHENGVRARTIKKVNSAIEQLNYRPNVFAQSLAGGRTRIIGLIYDNPNPVYISHIMDGVLNYCYQKEYAVIIHPCNLADNGLLSVMQQLVKKTRLTGMILTPPLSDSREFLNMLQQNDIQSVLISPGREKSRSDAVITNDYDATKEMIRYIISKNHQKIALIKGHPEHLALLKRTQGYMDAMSEAKLEIKSEYIIQGYNSYESGLECGHELMKLKDKPTAIFAANDEMASGVMKVILDSGYEVPKDFSIAGFDDTPVAQMLNPPLSTIKQPLETMGELAAKKLIAALEGLDFFENQKPKSSLIIRESILER
jgi:LacI family transcriptional regulator